MAFVLGSLMAPMLESMLMPSPPPPSPIDLLIPIAIGGVVLMVLLKSKPNINEIYSGGMRQAGGRFLSPNS